MRDTDKTDEYGEEKAKAVLVSSRRRPAWMQWDTDKTDENGEEKGKSSARQFSSVSGMDAMRHGQDG